MSDVNRPKVKRVRKEIILIVIFLLCAITGLIVSNLAATAKKPKPMANDSVPQNDSSTSWYKNRKMAEAAKTVKPNESVPFVPALMNNADGSRYNASSPVTNPNQQAEQQAEFQAQQAAKQLKTQQAQQAADAKIAAMKAPLTQVSPSTTSGGGGAGGTAGANSLTGAPNAQGQDSSGLPKDDPSMTAEKRNFMKSDSATNVLSSTVMNPVAPLVLAMGTLIPAKLDKQINSDLPGQIYGHVTTNVYDSRTHSHLLIPAGSPLVGKYDSAIAYGQDRLLVAWQRVNFPNGQWLDIQGMGGADPVGAGFGDMVDNHYWRIFGATMLTSVLAAGAQLSQPQQSNALQAPGTGQTVGAAVGTQIAQTGTMIVQKNINVQPTIQIRAGFDFQVEVNKDIVFPNEYTANPNK